MLSLLLMIKKKAGFPAFLYNCLLVTLNTRTPKSATKKCTENSMHSLFYVKKLPIKLNFKIRLNFDGFSFFQLTIYPSSKPCGSIL